MQYAWYFIFNRPLFEATNLVSRVMPMNLEGIGLVNVMITKGRFFSVVYDGVMLPIGLLGSPLYEFEGYAVEELPSGNVYLGVAINEN